MPAQSILNVDDYAPGRHARTKILTRAGFDVTEATTGEQTLRLAVEKLPRLIVLDINLPDMNGIEVCRRIKSDPVTSAISVLHLSASSVRPQDQISGLSSGADSYLTEPVEPAVLVATIQALLRARDAEIALRRSNEELRHFAYMVSHELKEPLRTITSYTQLLAKKYKEKLDPEADESIEFVVSGAHRMQAFIQDMLAFSQASMPDAKLHPVSMDSVLGTALFELGTMIAEAGGSVTHDPLPVVLGNEMRLVMVFKNLISNALKYRREELPRIHISASEHDGNWLFRVQDNGAGIDRQYWERIFGMFKRLHGRDYPGSGVGLALCKSVVENHGGQIWVESAEGTGSTFYFTLRAAMKSSAPG